MLTGNKRFTVDAAALQRAAAGCGYPAPGSTQLDRLQMAAAYAGIAYEAGEAGEDLNVVLPIFDRAPGSKRYSVNLDTLRAAVGDGQLTPAAIDALDFAAAYAQIAHEAGRAGESITDRLPWILDGRDVEADTLPKQ